MATNDDYTPSANELAVLQAVAESVQLAASEGQWQGARTDEVAFCLGAISYVNRADLLNTKRERLMTSLRKANFIEKVRDGSASYWRVTDLGKAALALAGYESSVFE